MASTKRLARGTTVAWTSPMNPGAGESRGTVERHVGKVVAVRVTESRGNPVGSLRDIPAAWIRIPAAFEVVQ